MFGLFKTKRGEEQILEDTFAAIGPVLPELVELMEFVNEGETVKPYEIGIFISSIVTLKILLFKKHNPPDLADKFNGTWLEMLGHNPMEKAPVGRDNILTSMQRNFPVYKKLFEKVVTGEAGANQESNPAVLLAWHVFSTATGKQKPQDFLKLVFATTKLNEFTAKIFSAAHE